jgi:phosphoadenosine phosphosulfate reductase
MAMDETAVLGVAEKAARLDAELAGMDTPDVMHAAITDLFPGRIALVSSFGADSAVLLHMAAQIDKTLPVLFIDTQVLFAETLAYRDKLVAHLGLENVKIIGPKPALLAAEDPENFLWASNPDRCCEIRKVLPLAEALEGYDAWITGRKRFQGHTREALALFDSEGDRIKVNPLAHWTAAKVTDYLDAFALPRHPLVTKNYFSIGCIPCTSPVKPGENARAGRWRGRAKVECGLHTLPLYAGSDI